MPWQRDSLETVIERIKNDIEAETGFDAHSAGSDYTHIANVFGALAHNMYGMIEYHAKQIADDAKTESVLLDEAAAYGVYRVSAAFAQSSQVRLYGNNGSVVLTGTELTASDNQVYIVQAQATANSGYADLSVKAKIAGLAGNQNTGVELTLVNPIAGFDNTAIALQAIEGGADIEPIERLRERLRQRKHNPPQGGCDHDYIEWAKAAHVDVSRAWVTAHEGAVGNVTVRFVTENTVNPIPNAQHINAVSEYINAPFRRPAGLRNLSIIAPTPRPLNLVFTSVTPNNTITKAAIELELNDLLRRKGEPGKPLTLRDIERSIRAAGATDFDITLNADIAHLISEFPVIGSTTWP